MTPIWLSRVAVVASHVAMLAVFFAVWWPLYSWLNWRNSQPERAVFFDSRPIDLHPWFFVPCSAIAYIGGLALLFVLACVVLQGRGFTYFMVSLTAVSVMGLSICALWPLNMRRPEYDAHTPCHAIMRWVVGFDNPANCFPSFHTAFAMVVALAIYQHSESVWLVWLASVLAALVCWSTIAVGQHYFLDLLGGALLAILSSWIAGLLTK